MRLPLQAVFNAELAKERQGVGVGTEKHVQASFGNIPVGIPPGSDLASEHVAGFENNGHVSGVDQVLRCAQSSQATAHDNHSTRRVEIVGVAIRLRSREVFQALHILHRFNVGCHVGKIGCCHGRSRSSSSNDR